MKFLCVIFALLVVLLSLKPCCTDNDCSIKKIAIHNTSKPAADNDCPGCSPFFSCGSCAGFTHTAISYTMYVWPAAQVVPFNVYRQPSVQHVMRPSGNLHRHVDTFSFRLYNTGMV